MISTCQWWASRTSKASPLAHSGSNYLFKILHMACVARFHDTDSDLFNVLFFYYFFQIFNCTTQRSKNKKNVKNHQHPGPKKVHIQDAVYKIWYCRYTAIKFIHVLHFVKPSLKHGEFGAFPSR